MKVVITGGTGFLGLRLARQLLARGHLNGPGGEAQPIDEMVLFDQVTPAERPDGLDDRVRIETGDIGDGDRIDALIDRDDISAFHLASVVSGGGEKDFDLAIRVNLTGGLNLLEALRRRDAYPRLVFASSIAVYGGSAMPDAVGDGTRQIPQTTYGMTKSVCELLINDYARKGYVDGRSARLPTVIIRPGKPNAAASSFASAVFREPLDGVDYALPVATTTVMPAIGYRAVVDGLIALHDLPDDTLGDDRAVGLPALTVTVADMIEALGRAAAGRQLGRITVEPDPFIQGICDGWPKGYSSDRANALGLPIESSLEDIIAYYIDDYVNN